MDGAACVQLCSNPPIFKYKLTALTFRICLVYTQHVYNKSLYTRISLCGTAMEAAATTLFMVRLRTCESARSYQCWGRSVCNMYSTFGKSLAVHLQSALELMSTRVYTGLNPFNFNRKHFLQICL